VDKERIGALNASVQEATTFASNFYYQSHDVNDSTHYQTFKELSDRLDGHYQFTGYRVYYLDIAPQFLGTSFSQLKS
ncbi:glucose-6-phosphate dehydrogenase, partial [Enterococcus faecium]